MNEHFNHDELTDHDMLLKLYEAVCGKNGVQDQVTRTNGRVSSLERWKSFIQGALALAGIVVVPAVGWLFYKVVTG